MRGVIEYLMKNQHLLEELPKEMLEQLMELVKMEKAKAGGQCGAMPQSAVQSLVDCVGDQQVRDIVNDLRTVSEPGGFLPSKSGPSSGTAVPKERGSGWKNPPPLEPPAGIKYIDQALDVQDALDRRDLEKRLR